MTLTGYKPTQDGFTEFSYVPSSTNDTNKNRRYFYGSAPAGANNYVINRIETLTKENN